MRLVERPAGIRAGGTQFRAFHVEATVDAGTAEGPPVAWVRSSVDFAVADDASQRLWLAVAGLADKYGIASGWDKEANICRGVSVQKLALAAGIDQDTAEVVLERLCGRKNPPLMRFTASTAPYGDIWVLVGYQPDGEGDL